jgi:sulfonate transport system ATP-binding protein
MNTGLHGEPPHGGVFARGLVRSYEGRRVIDELDLDVAPGEFLCLLGPSGCGKTTLLRLFAQLAPLERGVLFVPRDVAVVFQEHRLLPWKRVADNVALAVPPGRDRAGRVTRALEEVGLANRGRAWPRELSGGQAQRVALARALVRSPGLLLLDEPFASLDALTRLKMHALVRALCDLHRPSTVLVTHDVDESIALGDRVAVMANGRIDLDLRPGDFVERGQRGPAYDQLRGELLAHLEQKSDEINVSETPKPTPTDSAGPRLISTKGGTP